VRPVVGIAPVRSKAQPTAATSAPTTPTTANSASVGGRTIRTDL
jgi:hypothetical protein